MPRRPLVVTGLGLGPGGGQNWTSAHLRQVCGGLEPPLKHFDPTSDNWAGLEGMTTASGQQLGSVPQQVLERTIDSQGAY